MKKILLSVSLIAMCILMIAAESTQSTVDEKTARKLAAEQYNQLFLGAYLLLGSNYIQFPKLDPTSFDTVKVKDGCWQVVMDPPQGWYVDSKVSLDGKWVQITRAGFSPD